MSLWFDCCVIVCFFSISVHPSQDKATVPSIVSPHVHIPPRGGNMLLVLRVRPCPTSCSGPRPFYVLSSRVGLSSSRPGGAVGGDVGCRRLKELQRRSHWATGGGRCQGGRDSLL